MTMLRTLMVVLLLANVLFFFAGRGLFGSLPAGEPGRLASQVDPQKIRVVPASELANTPLPVERPVTPNDVPASDTSAPDKKVPDAKVEPPAVERCVAVAGLTAEQAAALQAKLSSENVLKLRDRPQDGSSWWVSLPPLPDRDTAVKRAEEVRMQGVAGAFVIREDGEHRNAVSLALFKNEPAAQEFMRQLQNKGVKGARITVRSVPGARHTLDLRGPADRVGEVVELALAANSGAKREECSPQ